MAPAWRDPRGAPALTGRSLYEGAVVQVIGMTSVDTVVSGPTLLQHHRIPPREPSTDPAVGVARLYRQLHGQFTRPRRADRALPIHNRAVLADQ